jgi:hypothetical protein
MKIGVLFNCQFDGLTRALAFLLPRHEVIGFELSRLVHNQAALSAAKEALEGCDVTLSLPAGPRFEGLSNEALRASCRRLLLLPPVTFSGFHPDTVYVTGADKVHRLGPTGAYHSRLIVLAYLGGLGIDEATGLFNALVFARLGYFTAFERDRALLCGQFARFGIDIGPVFKDWEASGCFMYSMNHPKIHVLQDLAKLACHLMNLDPCREPIPPMNDNLEAYPRHPVPEPLARRLGVPIEADFIRRRRPGEIVRPLALRDFVAESYAVYRSIERDVLTRVDGVTAAARRLPIAIDADDARSRETGPAR